MAEVAVTKELPSECRVRGVVVVRSGGQWGMVVAVLGEPRRHLAGPRPRQCAHRSDDTGPRRRVRTRVGQPATPLDVMVAFRRGARRSRRSR